MKKKRYELFIDTEDNSKGKFILGEICDQDGKWYSFTNKEEMKNFILDHKTATVYAHNCAYDIGNLFDLHTINFKYCKQKFISATYTNNGHSIKFLDSMNLLPVSIKNIGKSLGMEKMNMADGITSEYCRRDVDIMRKFIYNIREFCRELKIKPANTLSGISWNYFKKTSGLSNIKLSPDLDPEIRKSYFGGRVEIFRVGKYNRDFYENDVNSMYPYSMKIDFPNWNYLKRKKTVDLSNEGVATVQVDQDREIPILPVRMNKGIYFVNGTISGTWTYNELRYFVKNGGTIKKVFGSIETGTRYKGLFDDFVNTMYRKKSEETEENKKLFYKLCLNSLYGKTGFGGTVESLRSLLPGEHTMALRIFDKKNDNVYVLEEEQIETAYQNVLVASYITSEARINLHKHIVKVPDNIYYCDTDSLITDISIAKKTDRLGDLSLKGKYKVADFVLPKVYRLDDKVKAKGFRINDLESFEKLKIGQTVYSQNPVKIRSAIRYGRQVNVWEETPRRISKIYDKRKVLSDGRTRPLDIKELENMAQ